MTEYFKAPEIIQPSSNQIANLSDAEFKTLVIGMLRELVEYNKCIREEMKATLSEVKESPQGANSEGKETGTRSVIGTKGRNTHSAGTE